MPHATHAYPFEVHVLSFAEALSTRLRGDLGPHTFVMTLDPNGVVQFLRFEIPEQGWHQLLESLTNAETPHLFYDPFDAPEYRWLSWHTIAPSTMERLLGAPFEAADFIRATYAPFRAKPLDPAGTFPMSWGVMF